MSLAFTPMRRTTWASGFATPRSDTGLHEALRLLCCSGSADLIYPLNCMQRMACPLNPNPRKQLLHYFAPCPKNAQLKHLCAGHSIDTPAAAAIMSLIPAWLRLATLLCWRCSTPRSSPHLPAACRTMCRAQQRSPLSTGASRASLGGPNRCNALHCALVASGCPSYVNMYEGPSTGPGAAMALRCMGGDDGIIEHSTWSPKSS